MANNIRVGYADATAYIGIGTLRSMVCRKQVPHLRLGPRLVRFDLCSVDRWLAAHAVEPIR